MQDLIERVRIEVEAVTGPISQESGDFVPLTEKELAGAIDHTLLKPESTIDAVKSICAEAREHQFASVCINPVYVPLAAKELNGSQVKVCTVVGFPLGATSKESKAYEASKAIEQGATEIDMVIAVGLLKSGDLKGTYEDIQAVVEAATGKALVKVIIETALLTDEEKVQACFMSKAAGADFVKTSTGFSSGGATKEDIALMRRVVGPKIGVKASGGVRTREDARTMLAAGATRIGASSSVAIVSGTAGQESGY